jgi:hypothetical protein
MKKMKDIIAEIMYEMANVSPEQSGTGIRLYFSWGQHEGKKLNHGPRFKITLPNRKYAEVNIDNPICPKELSTKQWNSILKFISLNQKTIQDFWEMKLEDQEFHTKLKKV